MEPRFMSLLMDIKLSLQKDERTDKKTPNISCLDKDILDQSASQLCRINTLIKYMTKRVTCTGDIKTKDKTRFLSFIRL